MNSLKCTKERQSRRRKAKFAMAFASVLLVACFQNQAPKVIERATVSNTNNEDGPYEVLVVAIDDKAITSATLLYDTQRNEARERLDMFEIEEGEAAQSQRYSANIDGQPLGTIVEFGIELCDDDGACTFDPEDYPEVSHRFIIGKLPSSPEVLSLAPTEGPESGGTRVSILGNDFRPGLEVRFDGENAQTEYINQNQVLAITPPHVPESVDVSVTNPDSEIAILPRAFTYLESPRLLAIDPVSGPSSGDTLVTLRGTFFIEGTRAFFDSVPCRNFQILSTSEATCRTPGGNPGFVDVELRHPTRGESLLAEAFEYIAPPIIETVDPSVGSDLGGTVIVVSGENFDEGALVIVGGEPCERIAEQSNETQIVCVTAPAAPGVVDVLVINDDGQTSVLVGGFNYLGPPIIVRIDPEAGPRLGGIEALILGAGFDDTTQVFFGEAEARVISQSESVELMVEVPPSVLPLNPAPESGLARVDVTVLRREQNTDRTDVLEQGFAYFWPPEVLEVEPDSGPTAGQNFVIIRGRFFREFPPGEFRVTFDGRPATDIEVLTPTTIRVRVPAGDAGFADVRVENFEGSFGELVDGYEYIPPPVIDAVVLDDGPSFGGDLVRILGRDFREGAQVRFDGVACVNVIFISDRELTCVTPPGEIGLSDVQVINPDGQDDTLENGYEYLGLVTTPKIGLPAGFTLTDIRAAGIREGAQFFFGDTLASCERISDRLARCQSPARPLGLVDVRFSNPDGTGETQADAFEYRRFFDRSENIDGFGANVNHVETVDIDNDGDLDLIAANGVPNEAEIDRVYLNDGLGVFSAVELPDLDVSNKVTVGDLNGDDLPDLVVAVSGFGSGGANLFTNNGGGNFSRFTTPGTINGAFDAQLVDLVGDDRDDLFVMAIGCSDGDNIDCNDFSIGQDGLFERSGQGFVNRSSLVPHDLTLVHDHKFVAIDLDNDGDNDIVTFVDNQNFAGAANNNRHRILRNRISENLGFVEETPFGALTGDVFGIDSADLNNDGFLDVVAPSCRPSFGSSELVFINSGGALTQSFNALPVERNDCDVGVHVQDLDQDGDQDLIFTGGRGPNLLVKLYVNRGDATFADASSAAPVFGNISVRGAEISSGDYDGDGDIDLAIGAVSPRLDATGDLRLLMLE